MVYVLRRAWYVGTCRYFDVLLQLFTRRQARRRNKLQATVRGLDTFVLVGRVALTSTGHPKKP